MKFLITNIKYSIEQEDIDAYREDENIDDEVTDEEIVEEIKKSLPQHLIVEPDDDNDDLEEALNNEISNATGWCIETYSAEELVDVITSKLNNFMEQDHKFWGAEFGCEFDEIVEDYGFGYYGEEQFSYLSGDNIIDINTPLEDILNKISEAGDDVEKLRDVIFWIYENNDKGGVHMPKRKDVEIVVKDYFTKKRLRNLESFGATGDEGLEDISNPYAEVLQSLGFNVRKNYSWEGEGDGKYVVYLEIPEITEERIEIPVKAWHTAEEVTRDIYELLEDYDCLNTFEVQISLLDNQGVYVPDSDIQIGLFSTYEEAAALCEITDFQSPNIYEVYINEYNKNYEIVNNTRIH